MSCSFGVDPAPLIGSPFSLNTVVRERLLPMRACSIVSPCRSATSFAIGAAALPLCQGPLPIRSLALTAACPPDAPALRYACPVLLPPPAAVWRGPLHTARHVQPAP